MNPAVKKIPQQVVKAIKNESGEILKTAQGQVLPENSTSGASSSNKLMGSLPGGSAQSGFDQNAHAQETAAKLIKLRKRLREIQQQEAAVAGQATVNRAQAWEQTMQEKMQADQNEEGQVGQFVMPAGKPQGRLKGPAAAAAQKATKAETGRKKG